LVAVVLPDDDDVDVEESLVVDDFSLLLAFSLLEVEAFSPPPPDFLA
jgi:hypothetical protein